ncbi:thiamine-phosphate diphosphorylase [Micromonospora pattaloongensis]|uniref:Thiamine-phosphate synthase n=1 Tax=Micromonospora pattaloongensis TaxID=405436 RepID=A0A1H3MJ21_9ACTN|nr:thiamine-phosphate diphosphorylase [Micromonospora pattaloongensis]
MPSLGRLHLITDTRPGRDPLGVLRAALSAARAASAVDQLVVQVRVEDSATDREAYDLASRVAPLCAEAGATCLVNDRLHVALAVGAAGGHVGALDLPVDAARRVLGCAAPDRPALLGATARTPEAGRAAVAASADYLGVGPCFATATKDGLPAPIGGAGVRAVADAVGVPVVAIGGVTVERVPELLAAGAYGVAVVGAVSNAADPARATTELLAAVSEAPPRHAHRHSKGPFRPEGAGA